MPGRNGELGAGVYYCGKFSGVGHCARADIGLRQGFGDGGECLEGARGTQGDLKGVEATGVQRLGKGYRVFETFNDHHRDDAVTDQGLEGLGGHGLAPAWTSRRVAAAPSNPSCSCSTR